LSKLLAAGRTEEQRSYEAVPQAGSGCHAGLCRVLSSTCCYSRRDLHLYERPLIYLVFWRSYEAQMCASPTHFAIGSNETDDYMPGTLGECMLVNVPFEIPTVYITNYCQ